MWHSWDTVREDGKDGTRLMKELVLTILKDIEKSGMCAIDSDNLLRAMESALQRNRDSTLADAPFKAYEDSVR